MSDFDDIFLSGEEESRQKIAGLEHRKNIAGCFDMGYQNGLINELELQ